MRKSILFESMTADWTEVIFFFIVIISTEVFLDFLKSTFVPNSGLYVDLITFLFDISAQYYFNML